jgi:fructoselysine 6-kinase
VSVACVGDNCIDRYLGPPARDLPGGNALNVAVHLAHAGIETAYVGVVANDDDGELLLVAGRAAGVDMSLVEVRETGQTGVTVVGHDGADRTFVHEDYGVAADVRLDGTTARALRDRAWVHATRVAAPAVGLAALRAGGTTTSYDLGEDPDGDVVAAIAPHLDVAFASSPLGDAERLATWLREAGARTAVVTRGAAGALVVDDHGAHEVPADDVDVVDTLGAGDALIGAFIAARLAGADSQAALAAGSAAAARTCTHVGGWPS